MPKKAKKKEEKGWRELSNPLIPFSPKDVVYCVLPNTSEIVKGTINWIEVKHVKDMPTAWLMLIALPSEDFGWMGIATVNSKNWESIVFETKEDAQRSLKGK